MLRVLNAVRDVDIGIPLSLQQYKVLASEYLTLKSHVLASYKMLVYLFACLFFKFFFAVTYSICSDQPSN